MPDYCGFFIFCIKFCLELWSFQKIERIGWMLLFPLLVFGIKTFSDYLNNSKHSCSNFLEYLTNKTKIMTNVHRKVYAENVCWTLTDSTFANTKQRHKKQWGQWLDSRRQINVMCTHPSHWAFPGWFCLLMEFMSIHSALVWL